jgi:hypothetical protein
LTFSDEAPSEWQGASLFREKTDEPIYFFTAWVDYIIANRIGERKTIYRALANKVEVYNLINDPGETRNIADQDLASTNAERKRILSWVADQNRRVITRINNAASDLVSESSNTFHRFRQLFESLDAR